MKEQYQVENQERRSLAQSICVGSLCRVEKFDPDKMTVDVQPLSKSLDGGAYRTPPQILGVPVSMIRGAGFAIRPWYAAGDLGVVLYVDHDIDRILEAGSECEPNTERNHAFEDAVFIGAFIPAGKPVNVGPKEALVMAHEDSGSYIAMTKNGIEIKGNVSVVGDITMKGNAIHTGNITRTGNVSQAGNTTVDGDVVASGKSLVSHTHNCPLGGSTSGPN